MRAENIRACPRSNSTAIWRARLVRARSANRQEARAAGTRSVSVVRLRRPDRLSRGLRHGVLGIGGRRRLPAGGVRIGRRRGSGRRDPHRDVLHPARVPVAASPSTPRGRGSRRRARRRARRGQRSHDHGRGQGQRTWPALEQVEMCRERGDYLIGWAATGKKQVSTIARCSPRSTWPHGTACTGRCTPVSSAPRARDAIRYLNCERIDHGPLVLRDRELVAEAVDRRVAFTVCPSSDVIISKVYPEITDHPLSDMLASGLIVSLGSDDPPCSATTSPTSTRRCWRWVWSTPTDCAGLPGRGDRLLAPRRRQGAAAAAGGTRVGSSDRSGSARPNELRQLDRRRAAECLSPR